MAVDYVFKSSLFLCVKIYMPMVFAHLQSGNVPFFMVVFVLVLEFEIMYNNYKVLSISIEIHLVPSVSHQTDLQTLTIGFCV